jgi:hypothetical protein
MNRLFSADISVLHQEKQSNSMVAFKVLSPDELAYKQAVEGEDQELWIIAVEKELQSNKLPVHRLLC